MDYSVLLELFWLACWATSSLNADFSARPTFFLRRLTMPKSVILRFATYLLVPMAVGLSPLPAPPGAHTSLAKNDELSPELRLEIEARLRKLPTCLPKCAELENLRIEITDNKILLNLRYHVVSPSSVTLPIGNDGINPEMVEVDNIPISLLKDTDGRVYAHLLKGIHTVKIRAPLPVSELFTINLPMIPKFADVISNNYQILGMSEDGKLQKNIQFLRRSEVTENKPSNQLIAPLLRVTRDIYIGLEGKVITTIERLSPLGSPIVAEIPLLPAEAVISPDIRLQDRKALISLSPQETTVSWSSRMTIEKAIELTAQTESVVEIWRLKVTPLWHLQVEEASALRIKRSQGYGFDPVFKPWPGQKAVLRLSQPDPVDAPSFTIESSQLTVIPGARSRDIKLLLNVNASRGLQHSIEIPLEWKLVNSSIRGEVKPLSRIGRSVALPLLPGKTDIELNFREEVDFPIYYKSPHINLNSSSVNWEYKVTLPASRWLIWTENLSWGPVILFWSQIVIALFVACIFYVTKLTPISFISWILLTIGLTQTGHVEMVIPGTILCLIGIRQRYPVANPLLFNSFQLFLGFSMLVGLFILYQAISQGLLGVPRMYIQGNQSSEILLNWYQDRIDSKFPDISFISLPILTYRGVMLLWSLWIAMALIRWSSWIWTCLVLDQPWKKLQRKSISLKTPASSSQPPIPE